MLIRNFPYLRMSLLLIISQIIIHMDHRFYNYEFRKPRVNNPTYISSNVNTSMTFFYGSSIPKNRDQNNSNVYYSKNRNQQRQQPVQIMQSNERTRASHLSNYGTNTLINDKSIYDKQNSKFNPISYKPKDFDNTIHQYPKLTLQDKDQFYYRRLQGQNKFNNQHNNRQNNQVVQPILAGKHTYNIDPTKIPAQDINYFPDSKRYFTTKMLNHADQVGNLF